MLFAALLGIQCVWLLAAELARTDITHLPTNSLSAAFAAKQRDAALRAASFAFFRGDLWAESAFTYAFLVVDEKPASISSDLAAASAHARSSLDRALDRAPVQSGAWLLLAGLALRYPPSDVTPLDALKMSYYTGPSERTLIPSRLRTAARADQFDDLEMRELVSRDLRFLLEQKQIAPVTEAYEIASARGKQFIEQTVGDIDPSIRDTLRARATSPQLSLPN
jgi:hypothetical protein